MIEAFGWVVSHYGEIISALLSLLAVASFVTRLTASPKDDEIVLRIIGFLSAVKPSDQGGLKLPMTPVRVAPLPEAKVRIVREDAR